MISGGAQVTLALINGERDFDDLRRHYINGPSTTLGQGMAMAGGGDIHYDEAHGVYISTDTDGWAFFQGITHDHDAMTYGSIWHTSLEADRALGRDELRRHEAVHSDQWAHYGGGIGFPIMYIVESRHGRSNNRFEQEADDSQ